MSEQFTGQILANKYRLDSVLRDDDLGKIYRGTHVSMDKPVTVKVLAPALAVDENIVRRFSAEARTVSQISHPNILNVTDFGADGAVYIVYEGAPGATLKEAIRAEGKFSFERGIRIARQIASALSVAHAAGMIHQNLSSNNVLLARTPNNFETVKLTGFASESNVRELFDENAQNDNIEYLSPEQCADTGAIDERSDVYSLGVVLYEMLAGEVPFSGKTPTEIMLKSSAEPPAPLAAFRQDLPSEIEPIVLQAMAKNPEMRFHTMDEFSAALARVSRYDEQETVAIPQKDDAEPVNNNLWKTAFVVLAGISLLAIGLIYATNVKQTDPATQMQYDSNGQPVQPINPATGTDEQALSNLATMPAEIISNANMMALPSGALLPGGGDGYNPWGGSGPPSGAPPQQYIAPGGQVITIDPNNPSPFTQDGNIILIPVPANTAVMNANVKPTPTPRGNAANANTSAPPASNTAPKPTPQTTPATKPTPQTPPATKPAEQPKASPPAATEKRAQSGKEQDSLD
jgi:serine/threonine protein kinase